MTVVPPVAMTIAGTDSGGGAGLAADLRTFAAHGVFGTLVVTAVTAQDTSEVHRLVASEPDLVAAQLDAVLGDLPVLAAKSGLLPTVATVEVLIDRAGTLPPLVVDPVLVASSGEPLFAGEDLPAAYRRLCAHASVVTPNLPEAALLTGRDLAELEDLEWAARALGDLGPGLVVVKGGRRPGAESVDVAFDGQAVTYLRSGWVATRNVHGTGCTFSAAITANLALGRGPLDAAIAAKAYVTEAIALSAGWALGAGHGPIDQLGARPV